MGSRVRKGVAITGFVIAPLIIHVAMATRRGMVLAGVLVVAEAVFVAWIALSFAPAGSSRWARSARWAGSARWARSLRWAVCAAVLVLTAAIWWFAPDGVVASSAIPHAIAYLSVLAVFAASLAPGRKPIVTMFAEKSRGELPPALQRYTRRVTWAWCLFCAGQLLVSLALLLFGPVQVWSAFVNLLNLPLLIAMFTGEFAWRKWRHGAPRERLTDAFRMAGQITTHDGV